MTFKFGFLGLPQGGAKAGVIGDPKAPPQERRQRLAAFGKAIAPLLFARIYFPATDMGTDTTDVRYMLHAAGIRPKRRELRSDQSGYYTAVSVLVGVRRATRHLGLCLSGCTVAIEGFGKVGSALGGLLAAAKACVVAISTSRGAIYNPKGLDMKRLMQLHAEVGSRVIDQYTDAELIDCEALLELPVDVLCPCARHDSLHLGNANRVGARVVCAGANNPITPEAEHVLFHRGVVCLPFFVTNCGGTLGSTMEFASVRKEQIELFIDHHIGARVAWLLNEAAGRGVLPSDIAKALALQRFKEVQRSALNPTLQSRLFRLSLEMYRRGFVPGQLVGGLSLPYFERRLAQYS
jgi:glutamate dehydrogenase/leucine dehydrogenase